MKFEEALSELEKIVEEMENGELSLDQALKKYQEGVKLTTICTKMLDDAKQKIEMVTKSENGKLQLEPFEPRESRENSGELF